LTFLAAKSDRLITEVGSLRDALRLDGAMNALLPEMRAPPTADCRLTYA
jgi:hypothetical protein